MPKIFKNSAIWIITYSNRYTVLQNTNSTAIWTPVQYEVEGLGVLWSTFIYFSASIFPKDEIETRFCCFISNKKGKKIYKILYWKRYLLFYKSSTVFVYCYAVHMMIFCLISNGWEVYNYFRYLQYFTLYGSFNC